MVIAISSCLGKCGQCKPSFKFCLVGAVNFGM
uniref:Uncharacterized protein n=1 Tax=Podoviridae sp. ct4s49 TaxID=2823555 RepID=A0A8S5LEP1_9CAUD|nr:MAG TPA: Protein of unknown function DUF1450 [Podoviridae sp. ct4s49]